MRLREELGTDIAAIRAVVLDAFGQRQEADLVDALRDAGDLALSLMAERHGRVIGYLGLSRLKSPRRALALAPVAVATVHQRRGVGSRLIRFGLEWARGAGHDIVFVLGEPAYYARFGFSAELAARFPCRYAGPAFMALCLGDGRVKPGPVVYANAFGDLE